MFGIPTIAGYNSPMHKQDPPQFGTRTSRLRPWHLLILAVAFAMLTVVGLRSNYSHMVTLREEVYAADKAGKGVNQALQELRSYVGSHMNTSLSAGENGVYPPVQLKYTYDRLIKAKSQQTADYNAEIYTAAQKYCEAKIPSGFSGRYRIECIQEYVTSRNASPTYISPDLYKFDFYSPFWAPDLPGISMVLSIVCLIAFGTLWIVRRRFS